MLILLLVLRTPASSDEDEENLTLNMTQYPLSESALEEEAAAATSDVSLSITDHQEQIVETGIRVTEQVDRLLDMLFTVATQVSCSSTRCC